jgi:uncharacterized protein
MTLWEQARVAIPGTIRAASRSSAAALVFLIRLYRHMVSPLRPPTCRFVPTCSQYAADALTEYGLMRGSWLAAARLAKCGPWHRGGWDPIPDRGCRADFEAPGDACRAPAKQGESEPVVL